MHTFLKFISWFFQTATPPPPPTSTPAPSFWDANGDKIIVAVITAILVLLLSESLKALLKKLGGWLERAWQAIRFHSFTYRVSCFTPR